MDLTNPSGSVIALPDEVTAHLNGQLAGELVIGWASIDLDDDGRYANRYALLTARRLMVIDLARPKPVLELSLSSIDTSAIIEGIGAEKLRLIGDDKLLGELHYTRRYRRDVTRLQRKLDRRLSNDGNDRDPDWVETVERQAEARDVCRKCGQLIPAYADGVCPRCVQGRRLLFRLLDVAKPYRPRIWLALGLTVGVSALVVVPPLLSYKITRAILQSNMHGLFVACGLLVLAQLAYEICNGARLYVLSVVGTRVTTDLRHKVYAHLHELSLRYFAKRRTGSLITRVTNDTDRLWDFIVFGSVDFFRNCVMILFLATTMLLMNWRLALISLIPLPILAGVSYYRGMRMQALFGRLWTYWSRMTAVVGDAIPGVKVVKAFGNEQREVDRFDRRSNEYANKEIEIHWIWTGLSPTVSGIMKLGSALVWIAGGYMAIRHGNVDKTLPTLVAFIGFVSQFYSPIMELANSNRMVMRATTSAQRVFEVLDTPPDIFSRSGAVTLPHLTGKVEFRHVAFSYDGAQPALRDVSLSAEPGEMVGLCGPSGAGKSTLVNLICRFYDPTDGQILIDGIDLRDFDMHWLRRQIGVVLQEPYLFHGTIADNIRYGNPDATNTQVIEAARAANAHDFVVGFADGYDTMVGERGQSLSGGERQRISIARAILHNPRILILDEATSSVDSETEKQIQQALDRLVQGRTTFAIAHRLSTLTAADRLIVLEKGNVAEEGVHADLVNKEGGVYAKLHQTQVEMASLVAIL